MLYYIPLAAKKKVERFREATFEYSEELCSTAGKASFRAVTYIHRLGPILQDNYHAGFTKNKEIKKKKTVKGIICERSEI